jgi:hypothetical protein
MGFPLRLKLPAGYKIATPYPPVYRIRDRHIGYASSWEWAKRPTRPKAQVLPAGTYFAFPPGTAHFASTDVETIVQISTVGP